MTHTAAPGPADRFRCTGRDCSGLVIEGHRNADAHELVQHGGRNLTRPMADGPDADDELVEVDDDVLLLQPAIAAPHTDERDVRGTAANVHARQDVLGAVNQRAQLGLDFGDDLLVVEGGLF